jgi:hypothetical protein
MVWSSNDLMQLGVRQQSDEQREDRQRAEDARNELLQQLRAAALENANLAVRYLFTVNGGAAIAILGFVGALAGQGKIAQVSVVKLTSPLYFFAIGVAASVCIMLLAYMANSAFAEAARVNAHEYWGDRKMLTPKFYNRLGYSAAAVGVVTAVGSLGLFLGGLFVAVDAMRDIQFNSLSHLLPR